jgi:hypothetical protein
MKDTGGNNKSQEILIGNHNALVGLRICGGQKLK